MKQLSSAEVRQMYLDFFKEEGHDVEPSASLIPHDDPSLLWINSGVATLKKYFDGRVVPENPRIVNAQKSIRTVDIENVGQTARHHTLFEMLGNFSIGDYFKKEAIHWAWEFLTAEKWIGFDPDKLSVTIHPEDDEAFHIWRNEIGLPEERIIRLEENFWDIGEGPCGPNSEIFYDRGAAYGNDPDDPELFPGGENERYLEIWNLVFSQYNHNPDGSYTPLPNKNIDTGMGLERVVSIIQNGQTNFDTDLFLPIIQKTEEISAARYGENDQQDVAFKVIADHVRMISFAIGDGALPSNEGRGYVIRRLLRRAVRYGKVLGIEKPFMYQLTPVVGDIMHQQYPEVMDKQDFIASVIKTEEERFHETLNEGLRILAGMLDVLQEKGEQMLSGEKAFMLYDTYGFPFDLTEDYVKEYGYNVDKEQFDAQMQAQRDRARAARQNVDSMQVQGGVLRDIQTDSEFVGYEQMSAEAEVTALIVDDQEVDFVSEGQIVNVLLDHTPFYAESGGQVADLGKIVTGDVRLEVTDVQKGPNGQHVHQAKVLNGSLRKGDRVEAHINTYRRGGVVKNHTATHLLHQALKDIVGDHVNQAGSLVSPDRLRFDFSHFNALTEQDLLRIEGTVNHYIWQHLPVEAQIRSLEEAKAMGAMALFGEKYGERVRVIQIGDYSLELCGGCHVNNTTEIGLFKIISEGGIGAGTRRIEAVTGEQAYQYLTEQQHTLEKAAGALKAKVDDVPKRLESLMNQLKDMERENESLKSKLSHIEASTLLNDVQDVEGISLLTHKVSAAGMDDLRQMVDDLKQRLGSAVIVLASVKDNKVQIVTGVTKDLVEKGLHAGKIVKEVAAYCGGGGGGRPDMAQAGGKEPDKLEEALASAPKLVKSVLQS